MAEEKEQYTKLLPEVAQAFGPAFGAFLCRGIALQEFISEDNKEYISDLDAYCFFHSDDQFFSFTGIESDALRRMKNRASAAGYAKHVVKKFSHVQYWVFDVAEIKTDAAKIVAERQAKVKEKARLKAEAAAKKKVSEEQKADVPNQQNAGHVTHEMSVTEPANRGLHIVDRLELNKNPKIAETAFSSASPEPEPTQGSEDLPPAPLLDASAKNTQDSVSTKAPEEKKETSPASGTKQASPLHLPMFKRLVQWFCVANTTERFNAVPEDLKGRIGIYANELIDRGVTPESLEGFLAYADTQFPYYKERQENPNKVFSPSKHLNKVFYEYTGLDADSGLKTSHGSSNSQDAANPFTPANTIPDITYGLFLAQRELLKPITAERYPKLRKAYLGDAPTAEQLAEVAEYEARPDFQFSS